MDSIDFLNLFLGALLRQIPLIAVAIYGLRYSNSRKSLIPKVSKLATWGFSLLILHSLISVGLQVLVLNINISTISGGGNSLINISLLSFASYPLFIVGIIMLTRAIFIDRGDLKKPIDGFNQKSVNAF